LTGRRPFAEEQVEERRLSGIAIEGFVVDARNPGIFWDEIGITRLGRGRVR